jgi:hypothetical protein
MKGGILKMKKIRQNEVVEFALSKGFRIEEEYKDVKTKMKFICLTCNKAIYSSFDNFKRHHNCKNCSDKKTRNTYTVEFAKDFAQKYNISLINTNWETGVTSWVKLKCNECNHEFDRVFFNFKENPSCPKCRINPRKFTYEQVKYYIEIESKSGCEFLETEETYNQKRLIEPRMAYCKLNIKCSCGREFNVDFNSFKSGNKQRCNHCTFEEKGIGLRYTYEDIKNYIEIESESGCKLLSKEYEDYHKPLHIQCSCGNDFYRALSEFKGKALFKCQKCTGAAIALTFEQVYSELKEHDIELLSDAYNGVHENIKVKYNCGYIVERTITNIRKSNYLCPHCNKKGYKRNTELFKKEILDITNGEYELLNEYKTMNQYVLMKHMVCGNEWNITPHNFLDSGNRCPICNQSKGERRIKEVFDSKDIYNIPQKEFEGLIGIGGGNLSYDFYLPNYNLLIEFQGIQHEKPVDFNGFGKKYAKEQFKIQQEHDKRKREYAKYNNIDMLEIWYWDFDRIEEILCEHLNII